MAWSREQVERSLEEWQDKEDRCRRNWRSKRKGDPRRSFWFRLLKHAVAMVDRRTKQLGKLGARGVSSKGLDLIKEFEGFERIRPGHPDTAFPYQDPKGVWTIAYGETRGVSRFTLPWSRAKGNERLRLRVDRDYLTPVLRLSGHVEMVLKQSEADALASLVYNLGPGILDSGRTMGDAIRSRNRRLIANAFLVYDEPNNPAVHTGLRRRREAERKLFLS